MLMDEFILECRGCFRKFHLGKSNLTTIKDETSVVAAYVNCPNCSQVYKLNLRKHWEPV